MNVSCVFVYQDGTVGLRDLPRDVGSEWRVPKQRPLTWTNSDDLNLSRLTFEIDRYTRQGRMFDGRTIYCPTDWKVTFVGAQLWAAVGYVDEIDSELARVVRAFTKIARHERDWHELDRRLMTVPDTTGIGRATNSVERRLDMIGVERV